MTDTTKRKDTMPTSTRRTLDLDAIELDRGGHEWIGNEELPTDQEMCVMEAVSWVAGEPWSDHPSCVSPVIAQFLRSWNDGLDDEGRQRLKPYIERVIDTKGTPEQEQIRGLMAADWMVHHHLPAWLELANLGDIAAKVRSLPALDSWDAVEAATPTLREARSESAAAGAAAWDAAGAAAWAAAGAAAGDAARDAAWAAAWAAAGAAARDAARAAAWAAAGAAAWAAAWDAAWDAARDAAWDAAGDAARAAAGDAAWAAARDAAWAAAGAAAWAAAGDAARAAARDAAWAAVKPTVVSLQESAFDLLERMLAA